MSGSKKASGNRGSAEHGDPDRDNPDRKPRKDRAGTIGRALRTVYDDMLREEIPRDFLDLLRKLD